MGGKTGGGTPQTQNAGGAGAGMGNAMAGLSPGQRPLMGMTPPAGGKGGMGKGGGGMPQPQGDRGLMQSQSMPPQMGQPPMDPSMMQSRAADMQKMQQMYAMAKQGAGMEGGINSLQGGPNTMPPPAAATGASPGGPLSGRFGGWGAQQRGMGWGGGGGMGRWGGFGRNFGGPPPSPGGDPGGLASLQALAQANQAAPTTGAPLMADQMPQPGYAVGGTVAAPAAAPARVSWSPGAMNFGGNPAAAGGSTGMFPSVQKLAAIQQPAAYVRPVQQAAIWSPPADTTAAKSTSGPYGGLTQAQWMLKNGYGTLGGDGMYRNYRGGSGSHGGGRG